jgi:pimeloyl-ACP methyl ester carboxylesterase
MNCMGNGGPTVLFGNDFGDSSLVAWWKVQPAVSTITRACVYDRLGTGKSDRAPRDAVRTTQDQVDDLVALLAAANIEPPFVLVGASIGGYNVLLFTDQHPDWVTGIVLVDASHPDQWARFAEADPEFEAPVPGMAKFPEQTDFATSAAQAAETGDFGDRPLEVLTADFQTGDDPVWVALQDNYATYSTNSRHFIAGYCGHQINTCKPELVIDGILCVLDEVRASEE